MYTHCELMLLSYIDRRHLTIFIDILKIIQMENKWKKPPSTLQRVINSDLVKYCLVKKVIYVI